MAGPSCVQDSVEELRLVERPLLKADYSPRQVRRQIVSALDASGSHTVLVGDWGGIYTGTYDLYLQLGGR